MERISSFLRVVGDVAGGATDVALTGARTYRFGRRVLRKIHVPRRHATHLGMAFAAANMLQAVADNLPGDEDAREPTERRFRPPPQCSFIEGTPEEHGTLYKKKIFRQSREPYEFEFSKPGYAITGIACLPVSTEIQSPEAEVIRGGVNCTSVTIRLTPLEYGEWACCVTVCGRPRTTGPLAQLSQQQTWRAGGSAFPAPAAAAPGASEYVVPLHWVVLLVICVVLLFR